MAIVRLMAAFAVAAALIFVPAWTIGYWQTWFYLAIVFGLSVNNHFEGCAPLTIKRIRERL